ncbi:unnamed protein product [Lactuca virosa]|uniref:Uncharacterized protein n=1 Tax=Lactuca virosa TaxID=75947 RepID=A0AAU9PE64_9ASTR|nr:unnamed protein product [Lactuca virosa]
MALVGLEVSSELSGSTSLALMTETSHGIVTRSKLVINTQSIHKEMSRRVVLRLITSGLASASFVQIADVKVKPIKVGPPPGVSTELCESLATSSYSYSLFPICFIGK